MRYVSTIEKMGIQEGIRQGMQQGFQLKSKEIALRMFKKGYSKEMISELTGLNQNEIHALEIDELAS